MSDDLLLIGVIAKLDLKPTDIVVVKTPRGVAPETARRIENHVRESLRIDNRILVLDNLDIHVISPTTEKAS